MENNNTHILSSAIAIIGYSCRFPLGAISPDSYWKNLINGVDCIQAITEERWPKFLQDNENSAKYVAGLIDDVDKFDAEFFGISPREAISMDPQQRIALETGWEALESAGIQHEKLLGSNTGVFIGAVALDYRDRFNQMDPNDIGTYGLTGNLLSIIAGRLSYILGLEGPCVTVETACSSSLVAVHQACQNLRLGECDLAIAGGVNLLLSPVGMELLDQAHTLSPDGKCKTFDAKANGLVRGEGCGIIVLKRLTEAQRDNDPIVAIIRGTAINHDGRAASLSAPNALAQQNLLIRALNDSGVKPEEIAYIETHGTGTSLGDPIEVQALKEIYGKARKDNNKCVLGSVKSNIGHLESAAGIAGLIKAILSLENEAIPPQIHFDTLNPSIDLTNTPFVISKEPVPWQPKSNARRVAGVSSFGISGTNAHVIVEEAPKSIKNVSEPNKESPCLVTLSAQTKEGLSTLAQKWLDKLGDDNVDNKGSLTSFSLKAISYTTNLRRSHYKARLAITALNHQDIKEALKASIQGIPFSGLSSGEITQGRKKVAFVFPGLGSQWSGMGADLFENEEIFRNVITSCEAIIQEIAGWSLVNELNNLKRDTTPSSSLSTVQLVLFAVCIGLAELWKSWKITPRAVIGHSLGEVAAAYIAGIINLDVAIRVVYVRAKLMEQLVGKGSMAILEAPLDKAKDLISEYKGFISVAGSNSPRLTLLSGETSKLLDLWEKCHAKRIFFRMIKDSVPSHSILVDPLISDLRKQISPIAPLKANTSFYSAWQAKLVDPLECGVEYWINNLRQPVLFEQTISKMIDDNFTHFIEISPHPTLLPAINEIAQKKEANIKILSSLKEGALDRNAMFESLGNLYTSGINPDWRVLYDSNYNSYVKLPSYPWKKNRYWIDTKTTYFTPKQAENHKVDINKEKLDEQNDIYLHVKWQKTKALTHKDSSLPKEGSWLLLGNDNPCVKEVKSILESRNQQVIQAAPKGILEKDASDHIMTLDTDNPNYFKNFLESHFNENKKCIGIIHMLHINAVSNNQDIVSQKEPEFLGCGVVLHLLQEIGKLGWRDIPQLILVTQNTRPVTKIENINSVIQSSLWGMAQSLRYEIADLNCRCIDLDKSDYKTNASSLVEEILSDEKEEQVAIRSDGRYIARLLKGFPGELGNKIGTQNISIKKDGTYLISGGLGGLGLELAKWLAAQGAGAIILLSRSGPTTLEQTNILESLKDKDVIIKTPQVDVSIYSDLSKVIHDLKETLPPLCGIIHAAGVLEDGLLQQQSTEKFRKVFAPKVDGALNIHKLTEEFKLDFFILYSSASTLIGSPGQSNYAAANACLDALAYYRKSKGLPALSINWGAYNDVGLAAKDTIRAARLESRGAAGISIQMGLEALNQMVGSNITNIGFMPFNVRQWIEFYPQAASSTYLAELIKDVRKDNSKSEQLTHILKDVPQESWLSLISQFVQKQVSIVLQQDPKKLDLQVPLPSFGMDSLTGLELRNRLEATTGKQLPATLVWTYPDISSLANYLYSLIVTDLNLKNLVIDGPTQESSAIANELSEEELIEFLKEELAV